MSCDTSFKILGQIHHLTFTITAGVVSVKAEFDYEALATTSGLTMDLMVTDSTGETASGTMTFNFENKNESPTITIGNPSISADEGPVGVLLYRICILYTKLSCLLTQPILKLNVC